MDVGVAWLIEECAEIVCCEMSDGQYRVDDDSRYGDADELHQDDAESDGGIVHDAGDGVHG